MITVLSLSRAVPWLEDLVESANDSMRPVELTYPDHDPPPVRLIVMLGVCWISMQGSGG